MEKLAPLLVHKYWVAFGVALVVPLVGWWIDTAGVEGETEAAITKAEEAFKLPGHDSPNASWPEQLQKRNQSLAREYKKHNVDLYETQKGEWKWPVSINAAMQAVPYEGKIDVSIRRTYRKEYFKELQRVAQIVKPLTNETRDGKTVFNIKTSFKPQVTETQWPVEPPDYQEMWEVQQDLWLLKALLSAINDVNAEFDNYLQAPIKMIVTVELRGGNPETLKAAATGTDGESDGEETSGGMPGYSTAGAEPGGGVRGGGSPFGQPTMDGEGGAQGGSQGGVDFDLAELFGSDAVTAAVGAGTGEDVDADDATEAQAPQQSAFSSFATAENYGGEGQNAKRRRYIDDEEGAPFKTRGFKLRLYMDHTRLPDLMAQLANRKWPVEIVRVQQQILNPEILQPSQDGRGTGRGGMEDAGPMRPGGTFQQSGAAFGSSGFGSSGFGQAGFQNGERNFSPAGPSFGNGAGGFPREPMGTGIDGVDAEQSVDIGQLIQAGLQKTNLAEIVIAGKLTLFQPPKEPEGEDEADAVAQDVENPGETSPGDAAASDSSGGGETDSTPAPDDDGTDGDGTGSDSAPSESAPAKSNPVAPPATPTSETKQADESTSSPKDEQPE